MTLVLLALMGATGDSSQSPTSTANPFVRGPKPKNPVFSRVKRFNVGKCVLVGDRGMVTEDNLNTITEAKFRYIVGFHKRGREISDQLLF